MQPRPTHSLRIQAFAMAAPLKTSPSTTQLTITTFRQNACFRIPDSSNLLKYLFARPRVTPTAEIQLPPGERDVAFLFGVVADVQFARRPTVRGVSRTVTEGGKMVNIKRRRAWRESLAKLDAAIAAFNKADVDCIFNLGDVIEGYGFDTHTQNMADFRDVMSVFTAASSRIYHVIGNHCRCIPLATLTDAMKIDPYYSFQPAPGWRAIVLHTAELSASPERTKAQRIAMEEIIVSEERDRHHFHGAVGREQMDWFEAQLDDACKEDEFVVVLSHYPLADGSARRSHVLANTRAVRQIIERPGTPVVLCLAGHDHVGGSISIPNTPTRRAVTYLTLPAILEAPARGNAYAIVTAYTDGVIKIEGNGTMASVVVAN